MKRKVLKSVLCLLLIVSTLLAPMSALASSNLARIMKVEGDWVRLREGPNGNDGTVARLRKGTKLLYWGEHDDEMCKVVTRDGKVGYIYKGYLSTYGAMKKSQIYIATDDVKLYKRSGGSLKSNGSVKRGKFVVVYKTYGGWAYIKTMSGKGAYCQMDDLKRVF